MRSTWPIQRSVGATPIGPSNRPQTARLTGRHLSPRARFGKLPARVGQLEISGRPTAHICAAPQSLFAFGLLRTLEFETVIELASPEIGPQTSRPVRASRSNWNLIGFLAKLAGDNRERIKRGPASIRCARSRQKLEFAN